MMGIFGGENDPTAFTATNGGKAVQPGQLAYQGVMPDKGQNSLDQYIRSLSNYGGQQSQSFIDQGTNTYKTGQGYTAAPASYYSSILSGNPAAVSGALSPEISQLSSGFSQARKQLDQFGPMGGGRSAQMAQLPFQQQGAITNLISGARNNAAGALAGLGVQEQQLGLSGQSMGAQLLNAILGQMNDGRGQDVTEQGQNKAMAADLAKTAIGAGVTMRGQNMQQ